jgi:hypothetical protein
MRRLPIALAAIVAVGCAPDGRDDDDENDGGAQCDPALATGPTGTGTYGNTVYQVGDVVQDATFISPSGASVDMYDMCGQTVMLVHGESG